MQTREWPSPKDGDIARFFRAVRKTEACHVWQAGKSGHYGQFWWKNRPWGAHRLLMVWLNDCLEYTELCVRHACHNRACVNPKHLSWGNAYDNKQDSIRDGKHVYGSMVHVAKLTADKAREIFEKYHAGKTSMAVMATEYGVSPSVISGIINKKRWKKATANLKTHALLTKKALSARRSSGLSEKDIMEIWRTYHHGNLSQAEIASKYSLSRSAISAIVLRKTHQDVTKGLMATKARRVSMSDIQKAMLKDKSYATVHKRKLSDKQVIDIWTEYHATVCTAKALSEKYNVSLGTVSKILTRRTWAYVTKGLIEIRKNRNWSPFSKNNRAG